MFKNPRAMFLDGLRCRRSRLDFNRFEERIERNVVIDDARSSAFTRIRISLESLP